ncbi:MAG: serine/threonine protein kinase [Myxococcaceae bacterium]|nr:serine/threonine protein kinase [Myxococcaceae bacterium]
MRIGSVVAPPKQLGKYEVGAKIGGGGMASVYIGRATLDDGSEERVALKVIRDELAHDEQFKSMFIDEAKILAQLSHPNVIKTMEYGVTGAHRFIAMELLSGRTYSDVWDLLATKGDKMPPWLAAWLCARVAEGLHHAHELVDDLGQSLGVIHRDVNPSNIFLTHGGDVKLIDFGLAKARVRLSKSADGIVKGKIPYLAPEQAHGRPIDRRIDVYALGATLWESVTMKRLFKRETDVDTLRAIREAKVPDVRTLIEGFPPDLWYIIEKSLREDRDARYETADEFRKELDEFVGDRADLMKDELAAMLTRLFPGQEARQARWEDAAASVRMPMHTMPPPAPVPIASTSMLESGEESGPQIAAVAPESAKAAGAEASADANANANANADEKADEKAEARGSEGPAQVVRNKKKKTKAKSKSKSRSSRPPPVTESQNKPVRVKRLPKRAEPRVESTDRFAGVRDEAAPKRMWISVAVVVAVVLALALALSAR